MKAPLRITVAIAATLVIAGIAVLAVSAFRSDVPAQGPSRLPVVATIYPWGFVAGRVGGAFVDVTVVTPPGAEPHDYEPSPHDIVVSRGARLFLLNGNGMDAWAEKIEPDIAKSGAETITFAARAPQIGAGQNPHVWLDPVFMQTAAGLVRDALIRLDPAHASDYRSNADTFVSDLMALDGEFRTGLAQCSQHDIVVPHDAFRYLAARYGFTTIAITGNSPDEDPYPKQLADVADLVRAKGITTVFTETLASPRLSETVAAETDAKTMVLNPVEGLTAADQGNGKTYLTIMRDDLANLRTAMVCR
jgi:zinc transport system substrate-binding protein